MTKINKNNPTHEADLSFEKKLNRTNQQKGFFFSKKKIFYLTTVVSRINISTILKQQCNNLKIIHTNQKL